MSKGLVYSCTKCEAQFPKWAGRCTSCGGWGTVSQEPDQPHAEKKDRVVDARPGETASFAEHATLTQAEMRPTGLAALDLTLGGGLVDGSVTLVAGEPGVGKSTLIAQLGLCLATRGDTVLYVTGEESPSQIKRRLDRLTTALPPTFRFLDETQAETVDATIRAEKPTLTIIDSIQSLHSDAGTGEAGSPTQVKACAALLASAAKQSSRSVILVGQVTKDGDVAGPRVLEHLVDTVLFLEGDRLHRYRLLRALKHRFGPTDEVALLRMDEHGLSPVSDASHELLRDRAQGASGSAVSCLIEGHRPMLIEIQALVSPAGYGTPVRRSSGIDNARLGMLLAVLARRVGINALEKDVYANAAGGIDARDPSVDLALVMAITSAAKDTPLDPRLGMFGEVGLSGELRPVSMAGERLKELARMGFTLAVVPKGQGGHAPAGLVTKEATTVREAFQMIHLT